jgi:uncharacterized integral membrane protein
MNMTNEPLEGDEFKGSSAAPNLRRFGPGAVLAVLTLLFIAQNQEATDFEFLWFDFRTGLWLILLVSVVAGFAIGWFVARRRARRRRRHAD